MFNFSTKEKKHKIFNILTTIKFILNNLFNIQTENTLDKQRHKEITLISKTRL